MTTETYTSYINRACAKFGILDSEARKRYGNFTCDQWEQLLKATERTETAKPNEPRPTRHIHSILKEDLKQIHEAYCKFHNIPFEKKKD